MGVCVHASEIEGEVSKLCACVCLCMCVCLHVSETKREKLAFEYASVWVYVCVSVCFLHTSVSPCVGEAERAS